MNRPLAPHTLFVERRGAGAERSLSELGARLHRSGVACRLLTSLEEPSLHLLVIDGDPPLEADELEGARVWRFRAAEAT